MKKILLLVIGLTAIGGLAYYISSSGLLQGAFMMTTQNKTLTVTDSPLDTSKSLSTSKSLNTVTDMNTIDAGDATDDTTLLTKDTTNTTTKQTDLSTLNTKNTNDITVPYTCSGLTIDPDSVTVASDAEAAKGVDFTVDIALTGEAALNTSGTWKGTVVLTTTGKGIFTDSKGYTGTSLSIPASESHTSFDINYTGGAGGDTISATIKAEPECNDTLIIKLDQSPANSTTVCTSLDITPDSYELSGGESAMKFSVVVEGTTQAGSNSTVLGKLIIETDGSGILSNNKNSATGTSVHVPIKTASATVGVTYTAPAEGETLTAYIEDQKNVCSDSLTLTAATPVTVTPTPTPTPTPTSTPTTKTGTTTTTTATTQDTLSADADTIIGSSSYTCSDPFVDISGTEWFADLFCRMYKAGVINGRTPNSGVPGDYMTVAEAIKVIDLIAGYDPADAAGHTEDFLDVNSSDWFSPYVILAQNHGWVRTKDAGYYLNPNNPVSRGWFVLYATRAAGKILPPDSWDTSDIPFSDLEENDPYTYAIILAYQDTAITPEDGETTLVTGYSDGTFRPDAFIKRSEAMAIAQRIYLAWFAHQ